MKVIRFLLITAVLTTMVLFGSQEKANAAYEQIPRYLPDASSQYINLTRNTSGNDNGPGANLPDTYLRMYTNQLTDKKVILTLVDRGIGPELACNQGSGSNYSIFIRSKSIGNGPVSTAVVTPDVPDVVNPCTAYEFTIPAASFSQSSDLSHVDSGGTRLFESLVTIFICKPAPGGGCYQDPPSSASSATFIIGPQANDTSVEANFRLGFLGTWPATIYPSISNSNNGETGGTSASASSRVQNHSMNFKFKPPCNYGSYGSSQSVYWSDTDININPIENDIRAYLTKTDEQGGNSAILWGPTNLSANNGPANFIAQPNERYLMTMESIRGGNGIVFTFPFDSADFDLECPGTPITMSGSVTCDTIRVTAINEPDASPGRVYDMDIYVYERDPSAPDGVRRINGTPVAIGGPIKRYESGAFTVDISDRIPSTNEGFVIHIGTTDVRPGNRSGPYVVAFNQSTSSCYVAQCSTSIAGPIPGSGGNGVPSNARFTVNTTITNTGGSQQRNFTAGSVGTAFDNNNPSVYHPADPTGHPNNGGHGWAEPVGWISKPVPNNIPRGGSQTYSFQLTASNDLSDRTIRFYPDFPGRFAIGAQCPLKVVTYQQFVHVPSSGTPVAATPENPDSITYTPSVERLVGNYDLSGNFSGTSTYYSGELTRSVFPTLFYTENGVYQPPDFSTSPTGQINRSFNGGNNTLPTRTWNDTILDDKRFARAPGVIADWDINGSVPDEYCAKLYISEAKGWIGPNGVTADVQDDENQNCKKIVNQPFVRAYGGDVYGGDNGVQGYERSYQGSRAGFGVEFAAIATGDIAGLTTALFRDASPVPPAGLAFANTGLTGTVSSVNGKIGGNFGANRSQPEYYDSTKYPADHADATKKPVELTSSIINLLTTTGWVSGKQAHHKTSSTAVLSGASGYTGQRSLYIEGDVVITGNISYGTWTSTSNIPHFALIVKGNIYIANNVTQLDGLYVAQTFDANKDGDLVDPEDGQGRIYTCTQSSGALWSTAQLYNNCQNKLSVNGAFVADDVRFLRTHKTLREVGVQAPGQAGTPATDPVPTQFVREFFSNDSAAESFYLRPEMYLAKPAFRPSGSQVNGKYDSFVTLPPVL